MSRTPNCLSKAPTPPPAVITTAQVKNVDFAAFETDDAAAEAFTAAVKEAVAEEYGVDAANVEVEWQDGSDVVTIAISPPAGTESDEVLSAMSESTTFGTTLVSKVSAVPGIRADPNEKIGVSEVSTPKLSTPSPTEASMLLIS